ncbi:hypothetical protein EBS80_01540 [bacterium]|nr:hypothetical protein [bacterium]
MPLSGIVDTVVTRGKNHDGDQVQTGLSFVGWDNDASANGWRVAYHVECDLLGGTFAVHRIDVAPDVDDGSEPPALFNDGTGPESLPA